MVKLMPITSTIEKNLTLYFTVPSSFSDITAVGKYDIKENNKKIICGCTKGPVTNLQTINLR